MTDISLFKKALTNKPDDEIEEIYCAIMEERDRRNRRRARCNRYSLLRGARVRTVRTGTKIPKGEEGVIIEVKRTRGVVEFDRFGRYQIPLSLVARIE